MIFVSISTCSTFINSKNSFNPFHLYIRINSYLFNFIITFTLIPLNGVGTTCFHHGVIKIRQLIFMSERLPKVCHPWTSSSAYLMSPLLGHRPSLWITHKENGPYPSTRAQCGLVGANDCKCSRHQRLNVSSKARRSSR
jgi:hypothetical protein